MYVTRELGSLILRQAANTENLPVGRDPTGGIMAVKETIEAMKALTEPRWPGQTDYSLVEGKLSEVPTMERYPALAEKSQLPQFATLMAAGRAIEMYRAMSVDPGALR